MVVRAERLLFITTSVSNLGDGKPTDTGLWYAGHPSRSDAFVGICMLMSLL